ncbi:hypothetical protein HDC34_000076 [Pseudoclavibacter sp. JAI123]|uniref:hypothetical protein n=1 Tax=Pseudoclavibacter sp. JAI123 TaxID=2723065 RepID=UPI0018035393|nr:hypothetical protein [Pseudoclavibacter sp. JAI123]NYF11782.1 hypothetical protein [Pseudoclavibacter sp. JAI123]
MSAPRKRGPGGLATEAVVLWVALGTVVVAVGGTNVCVRAANAVDVTGSALPDNLFALFFEVLRGRIHWTETATGLAVVMSLGLLLAGTAATLLSRRRSGARRLDRAAALLGRGKEIAAI